MDILIEYINDNNQTDEICKLAVSQNGLALQYIKDEKQTNEICKIAVSQNKSALKYIKNINIKCLLHNKLSTI